MKLLRLQSRHLTMLDHYNATHSDMVIACTYEGIGECIFYSDDLNRFLQDAEVIGDSNEESIRLTRQEQYKLRSDSLYMAYKKYLALNQIEKAEASRIAWLAEIALIDNENPYTIITE